jgi:two-component system NtrC family sensor kinase
MFKLFGIILLFAFTPITGFAQNERIDSLRHQLSIATEDTTRILISSKLSALYAGLNTDSALAIDQRNIELSRRINYSKGEIRALASLGNNFETKGDIPKSLESEFKALEIAQDKHLPLEESICLTNIGDIFWDLNDFPKAINFYQRATHVENSIKNSSEAEYWKTNTEIELGTVFMLNNQLDSAYRHLQKTYNETLNDELRHPELLMFYGVLQLRMGKKEIGISNLRQSIDLFQKGNDHYSESDACNFISNCFLEIHMVDSALYYAKKGFTAAQSIGYKTAMLKTSLTLARLYEPDNIKEALYFRKIYDSTNDILFGPNKVKGLQEALSEEQDRQRKIEAVRIAYQNKLKQYGLLAGLGIFLLIAFILYRNNQHKKKANVLLRHQNKKVESTLAELKSTQTLLIQQEKMASLGELTSGIAHEIQNPLNFVNNFSELNIELIEEMQNELKSGKTNDAIAISDDIKENEQKINQHGKRADVIVKGMLQHARSGSGKKEPSNINALADESLLLAFNGYKVKQESFDITLNRNYDWNIGSVNIIPQDIGRVFLNLFNNAFYAVTEKKKRMGDGFQPHVSVTTKEMEDKILITISDNGDGVNEKLFNKIFQPFYTTKPTGKGTGLGLSVSYDIIKAHGGELSVTAGKEGGAEFAIQIPAAPI